MKTRKCKILILGKNGQLGNTLVNHPSLIENFDVFATDSKQLNITDFATLEKTIQALKPDYIVNCTAYTGVDKAETEKKIAFEINANAVGKIAQFAKENYSTLISFSTDYVFSGEHLFPYLETDETAPVNYYGYTKNVGEILALQENEKSIILRTSWLYGAYGNNFVKTMLRLFAEKKEIKVVNDQIGCPTFVEDLAAATIQCIKNTEQGFSHFGIYHYTNQGIISWYDFAKKIKKNTSSACTVLPILTSDYPTLAARPKYSVLNTEKIQKQMELTIPFWEESLEKCLEKLKV